MAGITFFPNLAAAIRAGFQVYDPHYELTPGRYGMKVRTKVGNAWAEAIVLPSPSRGGAAE